MCHINVVNDEMMLLSSKIATYRKVHIILPNWEKCQMRLVDPTFLEFLWDLENLANCQHEFITSGNHNFNFYPDLLSLIYLK